MKESPSMGGFCRLLLYYRGRSQQLFAIICQKKGLHILQRGTYPPFITRYVSFMIQPLRDNRPRHFMLLMRHACLFLSENALINSLWSTCRALNRRQGYVVSTLALLAAKRQYVSHRTDGSPKQLLGAVIIGLG